MNTENASDALRMLADAVIDREEDLANYPTATILSDSDEDNDSDSPVFDVFYQQGGSASIMKMTNFDVDQFMALYEMIQEHVATNWNGGSWNFLAKMFQILASSFERLIMKFMETIADVLFDTFVIKAEKKYSITRLMQNKTVFSNFLFARYATDVTFQQCNRPTGTMAEGRKYFSGKHHLYGLKIEVSVLPNGQAVLCSPSYPSAVSDIAIMHRMLEFHEDALAKRQKESGIADFGPSKEQHGGKQAVLTDKGDQGVMELCRAVHLTKKPRNGHLTLAQEEEDWQISSDRIIVENYFGRLCTLWALMATKYRWSHGNYDLFASATVALTNFHIATKPLREGDRDAYRRSKNRQYTLSTDVSRRRATIQKRCRQLRNDRRSLPLRARYRDFDHDREPSY